MTKKFGTLFLAASLLALGACSTEEAPKVVEKSASIIPSDMPSTPLNESLINMAGYLPMFADEATRSASQEGLSDAKNIGDSIDRTPLLGRTETIDGAKAYAILAASKSEAFRRGLEQIGASYGRDGMIAKLVATPSIVRSIPGYGEAKTYAGTAVGQQFAKVKSSSAVVKQAAYDLQLISWAKKPQDKQVHLNTMAANWNAPLPVSKFDPNTINYTPVQVASNSVDMSAVAAQNPIAEINDNIIAAAALHILRADSEVMTAMKIGSGSSCAYRAYLNSRMCMSATRYPFEHAFCISEHGQDEVKDCMEEAVGFEKPFVKKEKSATSVTIPIKFHDTKASKTTSKKATAKKK